MSALGQKQTCASQKSDVRFTPNSGHLDEHLLNTLMFTRRARPVYQFHSEAPKIDRLAERRLGTAL
jgi:hypothetical protein